MNKIVIVVTETETIHLSMPESNIMEAVAVMDQLKTLLTMAISSHVYYLIHQLKKVQFTWNSYSNKTIKLTTR